VGSREMATISERRARKRKDHQGARLAYNKDLSGSLSLVFIVAVHRTQEEREGVSCSRVVRPHQVRGTARNTIVEVTSVLISGTDIDAAAPDAQIARRSQNESMALTRVCAHH